MKVKGKNVIVTGAASGVGKELTRQLLEKGANVAGLDINGDNLKALEGEMNSKRLRTYVVDVGSKESIDKFNDADIIINNAGIIQPFIPVKDLDEKTIHKIMDVNFFGPVNLIRSFMDDLLNDRSTQFIVDVSSMGGFFPFPGQTMYGASKAALKIFTEGLYAELHDTNVNVMIVLPGAMATNITQNSNVDMLSAESAAEQIITGIEKDKFKLFLGSDSKFLKFLYKINSRFAIDFINKQMKQQ